MAKYDRLRELLQLASESRCRMDFGQLDEVVDGGLPASAHRYRAWWSNDRSGGHVQAAAWLDVGREVESVDLVRQVVTFVSVGAGPQAGPGAPLRQETATFGSGDGC